MDAQTYPYGILEEVEASSHKMEKPTDAACAGENMLLAATELGLGSRSEEHTSELQSR